MDEYIELLDKNGKPTNTKCLKSIAHKNGWYHPTIHVWVYRNDGHILLQKRKNTKKVFPNLWDVSVAGHITFGETPENSAIREVVEEIGLHIKQNDLTKIGTYSQKVIHSKELIDHELHHIYICELNSPFESLKIQKEEVEKIALLPIQQFELELKTTTKNYVPHTKEYYSIITSAIKSALRL